jgi:hypothetical protein
LLEDALPYYLVTRNLFEDDREDAVAWGRAGRTSNRIPSQMLTDESPDGERVTVVGSLVAAYGDPWVDPRSGGVIGQQAITGKLLMTLRQAQRTVLKEPWIRWVGDIPATNVASLASWDLRHQLKTRNAHRIALGLPTITSSGSNA